MGPLREEEDFKVCAHNPFCSLRVLSCESASGIFKMLIFRIFISVWMLSRVLKEFRSVSKINLGWGPLCSDFN